MKPSRIVFLVLVLFIAVPALLYPQSNYNFYFGDLHSHSWYSDGNQDQDTNTWKKPVARSFTWARQNANSLHFLGISDHNHNESLNMTLGRWRAGNFEADSVNQDGVFPTLYGQEWGTLGTGGHVLIYGTDKLFGWNPGVYDVYVPKGNYGALFDSVRRYNGFCYLAHPSSSDFDGIFTGAYNALWDSVVQGVAMKNGPATSTNTSESNPSSTTYESRYHDLLRKGYHVAPIANQDNHNTTFGRVNQQRTAVLATSLTRANILDALRNRRVYATEDHNLQLQFEVGTHQMGEIFSSNDTLRFRIKITDPGETINSIELRYGVPGSGSAPTVLTAVANKDSLIYSWLQPTNTTYYYYVYVVEADGHQAWSAPMWVTQTTVVFPSSFTLLSPANNATDQPVSGTLSWQSSSNATQYDVYLDVVNPPLNVVSANQVATSYSYSGLFNGTTYYWKVVAKNTNGQTPNSGSPWSFTTSVAVPGPFTLQNPSNNSTDQPISGTLLWQASVNATHYDVYLGTTNPPTILVSANQSDTVFSYNALAHGTTYYWKVVAKNNSGQTTNTGFPWSFTTIIAAPGSFSLSNPSNGSVDQPLEGTLSWQTSTNAAQYDVYLDTINPPATVVSTDQAATSYSYSGLSNDRVYYWKVVAKNIAGQTPSSGSPWSFSTLAIAPPGGFSQIAPVDGESEVPINGTLSWQSSPNAAQYDVYLDTLNPPSTLVSGDQTTTSYSYSNLLNGTTYYWKIVAKNPIGQTISSNSPWSFTTSLVSPPPPVSNLVATVVTTSGVTLEWTDNASNENGYRVYRSLSQDGPFIKIGTDLPINTVSFSDSTLAPNQRYYYRVVPFNDGGEGDYVSRSILTLAETPGLPIVLPDAVYSLKCILHPATNSSSTQFSILVNDGSTVSYVQQNGQLGDGPSWLTYSEWGEAKGVIIRGLLNCTEYSISVGARNDDGIETPLSNAVTQSTICYSVSSSMREGWNLISVPVTPPFAERTAVFPSSVSSAYRFDGSYRIQDTLQIGVGYWLKFSAEQTVDIAGEPRFLDTLSLTQGWNIIGSISTPIAVSDIIEEPAGVILTNYFGFNNSYSIADSIKPAKGYWVKAATNGNIILSPGVHTEATTKTNLSTLTDIVYALTFTDTKGGMQKLYLLKNQQTSRNLSSYELPPPPPAGTFDVRFASERYAEFLTEGKRVEFSVTLQSSGTPITVSLSAAEELSRLKIVCGATTYSLSKGASVVLPPNQSALTVIVSPSNNSVAPDRYVLFPNYPNPFNPSTEISYQLPSESVVRLTVFNLLGEKVATLVNEKQSSGMHSVLWKPNVPSGMYYYRMDAVNSQNPSETFHAVRRMLLLK